LQCVAVCLQCVTHCSAILYTVTTYCNYCNTIAKLQFVAVCCSVLQCVAACCSELQCVTHRNYCSPLPHSATPLQHTATNCNTVSMSACVFLYVSCPCPCPCLFPCLSQCLCTESCPQCVCLANIPMGLSHCLCTQTGTGTDSAQTLRQTHRDNNSYGVATISRLLKKNDRSLLQKSPRKETIFCKRDLSF